MIELQYWLAFSPVSVPSPSMTSTHRIIKTGTSPMCSARYAARAGVALPAVRGGIPLGVRFPLASPAGQSEAPKRSIAHIDHQSLARRLAAKNSTTRDSAMRWVMPSVMTARQDVRRVGVPGTG